MHVHSKSAMIFFTMIYSHFLLLFILFSYFNSSPAEITHHITDRHKLESLLCSDNGVSFSDDVTLLLSTKISHEISQNKSCRVNISQSQSSKL